MKRLIGLAAAAAGFAVSAGVCLWLLQAYAPGLSPGILYLEAGIVAKLVMLLILLLFLPILGLGLGALISGKGRLTLPLQILAASVATLGLLGALYGVMTIQQAIAKVGPTDVAVTAPSYAEAALVAAVGFFAATLAMGFRVLGDRRR